MRAIFVFFLFFSEVTKAFGFYYYMHKMPTTARLSSARKTNTLYGMQVDDILPLGEREVAMKKFQQQLLQLAVVTSVIVPQGSTTWASGKFFYINWI
jgi:hypothetical protein